MRYVLFVGYDDGSADLVVQTAPFAGKPEVEHFEQSTEAAELVHKWLDDAHLDLNR